MIESDLYIHKCFFCKEEINSTDSTSYHCDACAKDNGLDDVITFYYDNGRKIEGYGIKIRLNNGIFCDIIAHFEDNETRIYLYNRADYFKDRLVLPGTQLTLQNVKKKLPIYLLFS